MSRRRGFVLSWRQTGLAVAGFLSMSCLPILAAATPEPVASDRPAVDGSRDSASADTSKAEAVFEVVQEGQDRDGLVWDPGVYAAPDRGFAVLLPRAIPRGALLFVLDHRARQPVAEEPARDLLGFDAGGLKILLGLRYGLLQGLDIGVERLNGNPERYDVYGFDARWTALRESRHFLDLCLTGGTTWFEQEGAGDAVAISGRVQAGRSLFRSVYLSAGILGHSDSSHGRKASGDSDYSVAIPVYAGWVVLPTLTLAAEAVFPVAGYSAGWASWTAGPKFTTHGHTFALLLSTTQYTTTDGLVAGSDRPDKPVFGFSITRQFGGE